MNRYGKVAITVYVTPDMLEAVEALAESNGEKRTALLRRTFCAALGIPDGMNKQGRPKVFADRHPMTGPRKQIESSGAQATVTDLKNRHYSKHAVAAITKLPYAEVERLWGA